MNGGIIKNNCSTEYLVNAGIDCGYNSSVNVRINGGKIISNNGSAIYSGRAYAPFIGPTIELFGGLIKGGKYGILVDSDVRPTLIVGNVNNIYNQQAVIIEGGQHAIYMNTNSDDIYFYNGTLRTLNKENEVLSGGYIQQVRQGYSVADEKDASSHYKYLINVGTSKMYAVENKLYSTLQDAATAAVNGDTIVLLKSGTDSSRPNFSNKNITLLLNNYTLTKTTNTINIGTNATLTITGLNAIYDNQNVTGFTVSGELKMCGAVNMSTSSASYPIVDTNGDNAIIDLDRGEFQATGQNTKIINIDNKATCYIRGNTSITLNSGSTAIYNSGNGTKLYLDGGYIHGNYSYGSYGVYNTSNMEYNLRGTSFNIIGSSSYAIYNTSTSSGNMYSSYSSKMEYTEISVSDDAFGIYNEEGSNISIKFISGPIKISSSTTDSAAIGAGIFNSGSGNIEIGNSSKIDGSPYGIKNMGTGNITINSGNITGYRVGIYNTGDADIEVNGGTVCADDFYDRKQGEYAIYNTNSNANIIIGDNSASVSTTTPLIRSDNASNPAIYTDSPNIYFYNGRIENGNDTLYNKRPIIRKGYMIHKGNETYRDVYNVKTRYFEYLEEAPWKYTDNGLSITNGIQTLDLGDKVLYDPTEGLTANKTYTSPKARNGYASDQTFTLSLDETARTNQALDWRVLGVDDNGLILLVPTTCTRTPWDEYGQLFWIEGKEGVQYGADELNNIASIYGYGKGATGARSIQVEDINKLIRFNPNDIGNGQKYSSGNLNEYGNEVTYSWSNHRNRVYHSASNGQTGGGSSNRYDNNGFNWYDLSTKTWKQSRQDTSDPKTITTLISTEYNYKLNTSNCRNIELYNTIADDGSERYWLASLYVLPYPGAAYFGLRTVLGTSVESSVHFYYTDGLEFDETTPYGVRPVVTLEPDITFVSNGLSDGVNSWKIQ